MKTIKIKVSTTHIKNGKINSTRKCPIALAIQETMNISYREASVYDDYINLEIGGTMHFINLPKRAIDFIDKFDDRRQVKPFCFQIKISKSKI
ncbi:MAG: hypothetical protein AABY22_19940 [Nanoarchaeota archaeon]